MEHFPHWDHDTSRTLMEEMNEIIGSGKSELMAANLMHDKYPDYSVESIRSKQNKYQRNGGLSHINQIFNDCEIAEIIGILETFSLVN
jgi:hypothetical protein